MKFNGHETNRNHLILQIHYNFMKNPYFKMRNIVF